MWLLVATSQIGFKLGTNVSLVEALVPQAVGVFAMSIVVSLASTLALGLLCSFVKSKWSTFAGILLGTLLGVTPIWILSNVVSIGGVMSLMEAFNIPFAVGGALCSAVLLARQRARGKFQIKPQ